MSLSFANSCPGFAAACWRVPLEPRPVPGTSRGCLVPGWGQDDSAGSWSSPELCLKSCNIYAHCAQGVPWATPSSPREAGASWCPSTPPAAAGPKDLTHSSMKPDVLFPSGVPLLLEGPMGF